MDKAALARNQFQQVMRPARLVVIQFSVVGLVNPKLQRLAMLAHLIAVAVEVARVARQVLVLLAVVVLAATLEK